MKSYAGIVGVLLAGWALGGVAARAQGFPEGPGKAIVQEACSVCHGTDLITSTRRTKAEWTNTVEDMVSRGAPLKEGEREMVIEYLAANFGPDKPAQGARNEKQPAEVKAAQVSPSGHDFSRAEGNASRQRFQPLRAARLMAAPQGLKPRAN